MLSKAHKTVWMVPIAIGLFAISSTAEAVEFVGRQTGTGEWTYDLTFEPGDNYGITGTFAEALVWADLFGPTSNRSTTITLSGLSGVTRATGPSSTDFTPTGGSLDTTNRAWLPEVLDNGTTVRWTNVVTGPASGFFGNDEPRLGGTGSNVRDPKHSFGFKVFAIGATNGQVALATDGFSKDEQPSVVGLDRDISTQTAGPVSAGGGCPASSSAAGSRSLLGPAYAFRSRIASTPVGRQYVKQYYRHAPQVAKMLMFDVKLRNEFRDLLERGGPSLTRASTGRSAVMSSQLTRDVRKLLDRIAMKASPALKTDLVAFRSLSANEIKRRFGIESKYADGPPLGNTSDNEHGRTKNSAQLTNDAQRTSKPIHGDAYEAGRTSGNAFAADEANQKAVARLVSFRLSGEGRQSKEWYKLFRGRVSTGEHFFSVLYPGAKQTQTLGSGSNRIATCKRKSTSLGSGSMGLPME